MERFISWEDIPIYNFFFMFSFVKKRTAFYLISGALFLGSLASPWILGLNEGIDMTGGIQIEYHVENGDTEAMIAKTKSEIIQRVRATLDPLTQDIITDTLVYRVSGTNNFIVEAGINESHARNAAGDIDLELVETTKTSFVNSMKTAYDQESNVTVTQARYVNIGASFGAYIKNSGYITIAISLIAISLYIMYAFQGSIP